MEKINKKLKAIYTILLSNLNVLILASVHTALTVYSDKTFFYGSAREHVLTIVFAKLIVFSVLFFWWKGILILFAGKNKKIYEIFSYSLPYGIFLLIYLFCKHSMSLTGDEFNIYSQAMQYNIFPYHFTYLTGLVYIVSYMIVPCQMGTVFVKVLFQSLTCGYCVYRMKRYFGKKGYLCFILFLLYPVMTNGIEAHRMQFYGLLYLASSVKLLFDWWENKKLTWNDLFVLSLAYSILGIWRKEGIYLLIIAPVMICFAYHILQKSYIKKVFIVYLVVFGIVYIPQCFSPRSFLSESSHTYNEWFVNMCREGLDKSKYPVQMKMIDKYMSLAAVDYINEQLGDENYEDEYIAWRPGYVGIRDGATLAEYNDYEKAVRYLVIHEPCVFLKTRIGLWKYTAGSLNTSSVLNLYESLTSSLNIPLIVMLVVTIMSIIKQKWLTFFMAGFSIAHCMVTLLFSPAAYFKYYYHMYLLGWLFLIVIVIGINSRIESLLHIPNKLRE